MADDDKGVKPAPGSAVDHSNAGGAVKPSADVDPQTEWTASDRRGPLGSAGDEDVERYVPAHETDAEGGADPASSGPTGDAPAETFGATAAEEPTGVGGGSQVGDGTHETREAASAGGGFPATSTPEPVEAEHKRSLVPVAARPRDRRADWRRQCLARLFAGERRR